MRRDVQSGSCWVSRVCGLAELPDGGGGGGEVMWDKLDKCLPWMKSIFAEYFY